MELWDLLKEALPWALPAIILLSCFFEFTKIPINPLSALFKWISGKVTSTTDEKIDRLEQKIDDKFDKIVFTKSAHYQEIIDGLNSMQEHMQEQTKINDEREMKRLRQRILIFAEDLRNGKKKAKEAYHDLFRAYNDYMHIIDAYEIQNGVIEEEYNFILKEYRKSCEQADFLSS